MGFNFIRVNDCDNVNDCDKQVNPDPYKYTISSVEEYEHYFIALLLYHGCTTFNGYKLLLIDKDKIKDDIAIDPHLLGNGHFVIARFEPTPEGWDMARRSINVGIRDQKS